MADIIIRGTTYPECPGIDVPDTNGNDVHYIDTSDATLDDGAKLDAGETVYAHGVKITGTMPAKTSSDLTASGDTVTVPAGHYKAQVSKSVQSGSATPAASISGTGATVTPGSNTLKLSKSVQNTPQVSAGYVSAGTAGNSAVELTASVPTKAAATITPGTSDQEIASGTYLTGKQTVKGDPNLTGANIVAGTSIFNVAGQAQIPVITQDSVTKVLHIS